jgi:CRP-like cAMP-binding protein
MIIEIPYVGVTVDIDYVIYGVLAYCVGLITVMSAYKLRRNTRRDYHADDMVVQAVVMEYTRRLKDYDRVIAEMRSRLDIVEAKAQGVTQPHATVTPSQPAQPHTQPVSEPVAVTQHPQVTENIEAQNGTTDYILKLLMERPRTSRDVQNAIGRTREHTARLMKKLHDGGLVSRDLNIKPFRYAITEAGQARLKEKPVQAAGLRQAA